ncbi:restriction endonuclease subunit S [Methanolobus sp. WCC1]|uniref:restriction endonuclease subunit S n=1 Tax=unclassified Methanolobus TaxID=2629569 RepID=UPI00324C1EB8
MQRGFDLPTSKRVAGSVPVVASRGITGYHNESKVKGPGVVIGRSGSIGGGQFIPNDFWPLNTTLWVKDFKNHNERFIYYLLKNIDFTTFNAGASVPTLNRNHLSSILIPLFSLEAEREIANILSAYDDLIENNQRRIELLEQAARLLYKEWFVNLRFPGHEHVKIIDGVPEGWHTKIIDDVCDTIGGGTPSTKNPDYWDGGDITWVIPSDITKNDCLVLIDSERKITEAGLRSSSARMVPSETILMTSRASVGFFGLIEKEVCTNQGFINIIPHEEWLRMYLLYNLMWRVEEIRAHAGGSTYKEISKGRFRQMPIIVPEKMIAKEFYDFSYQILQQIRTLKKQQFKLKEARDLLLPKLMSGEISV